MNMLRPDLAKVVYFALGTLLGGKLLAAVKSKV